MAGQIKRLAGPAHLANAAANIYAQNALIYDVIKHIHIANKTAGAATFTLYVGATGGSAAGTEIFFQVTVAANSTYDWYGALKLVGNVDFLTGLASAATTLTITVEGESYVV